MKTINADIPFEEIPSYLELNDDAIVFISSDIKNFALKAKAEKRSIAINAFIDQLQRIIKNGTIIIPAYTDYLKDGDTFDYYKSKPSTGAISNKVFKRKDFKRTLDPLHSVFVWGKHSKEILKLKDESTFGEHSIFGYLHKRNCTFLFFDVHIVKSLTFVHSIEERLNVKYRRFYNWMIYTKIKEQITETPVQFHTRKMGVVTDFDELNATLIERQLMERYNYSTIKIDKIKASDIAKTVVESIENKRYLYRFSLKLYLKSIVKKLIGR